MIFVTFVARRNNRRTTVLSSQNSEKINTIAMSTTTHGTPTTLPQHNQCFRYQWLNDSDRSVNSGWGGSNCDDGLSGWYKFGGDGVKMPASCVPRDRCGAYAPGWMNGTHPTFADGNVTSKVCYHHNNCLSCLYVCCEISNNTEVVNCGQYYVYKLSQPPVCILRHCGSDK